MTTAKLSAATSGAVPLGPSRVLRSRDSSSPISIVRSLVDEYGDAVRYRTPYGVFFLFNDPGLIREVLSSTNFVRGTLIKTILGDGLLAANGPHWERQRRRMSPEFRPARIDSLVDLFARVTEERLARWPARSDLLPAINLSHEMDRIALSNVCRALFGIDLGDEFLESFGMLMRETGRVGNAAAFGFPLVRQAGTNLRFREAMQVVEHSVRMVLAAEPAGAAGQSRTGSGKLLDILRSAGGNGTALTERQIRDEIVTMITAGHETTAVTLAWSFYALASRPGLAARFFQEIDQVLGQRRIQAADLPRLVFTRQLIDETLRLYPPVWLVSRVAQRDGGVGKFLVPAGSGVLISPFVIQRHPRYWSDPDRFDPDRFAPDAPQPAAFSYIPFLAGRHVCLGKQFALTEVMVVLATVAQRFRLRLLNDRPVEWEPLISLRMREPLMAAAESRCADRSKAE